MAGPRGPRAPRVAARLGPVRSAFVRAGSTACLREQGGEEAVDIAGRILSGEEALGFAATAECAQRGVAVLGRELTEGGGAARARAAPREVGALAVGLESVCQLLDAGGRGHRR